MTKKINKIYTLTCISIKKKVFIDLFNDKKRSVKTIHRPVLVLKKSIH